MRGREVRDVSYSPKLSEAGTCPHVLINDIWSLRDHLIMVKCYICVTVITNHDICVFMILRIGMESLKNWNSKCELARNCWKYLFYDLLSPEILLEFLLGSWWLILQSFHDSILFSPKRTSLSPQGPLLYEKKKPNEMDSLHEDGSPLYENARRAVNDFCKWTGDIVS